MTSPLKIRIRRCRAQAAIEAYCKTVAYDPDADEALTDLLTDLRHWSNGHSLDFKQCLDMSDHHHQAEVQP